MRQGGVLRFAVEVKDPEGEPGVAGAGTGVAQPDRQKEASTPAAHCKNALRLRVGVGSPREGVSWTCEWHEPERGPK